MTVSALYVRKIFGAYGFAIFMAGLAIVPGCNFLYSGHGGVAWLLLPLALPVALFRLYLFWRRSPPSERPTVLRYVALSVFIYLTISYGLAYGGAKSIQNSFGLQVDPTAMWGMFTLPFGLIFARGFFGL